MKFSAENILLPFKKLINGSGANYAQVCHIVDLKLMIDNRKARNNQGSNKNPVNTLLKQSLTFIFVGAMLSLMFIRSNNLFLISFSTHIYLMVMITITMLSEYSISLFDTRENQLVIPLPITSQTLGWSRVLHILIYLVFIAISLLLPSLVIIAIKFGALSSFQLLISGLLNTVFTLFFTIFVYLGLMKLTSGERLKDMMMYIQVGFTILIMVGYQFIPKYLMPKDGAEALFEPSAYFLLIPPAWFAMLGSVRLTSPTLFLIGSAVAVFASIGGMTIIGKKLFYGFEGNLKELGATNSKNEKADTLKSRSIFSFWAKAVAILFGVPKKELPIFELMWKLTGRERLFKQTILPIVAYMGVFPLLSLFTKAQWGDAETKYVIFLYFSIMTSGTIPSAIWIGTNTYSTGTYRSLPSIAPSQVISNAIKAAMGRYFLPVFLVLASPLFYFKGVLAITDVASTLIFNLFVAYSLLHLQTAYLPFTQSKNVAQGGKTALKMMFTMIVAFPVGFLHVYLSGINGWLAIVPGLLFLPLVILYDKRWIPSKFDWKMIELANKA
jgi:hypothetical protein